MVNDSKLSGKETKIGVALIALLLMILCAVLMQRLRAPEGRQVSHVERTVVQRPEVPLADEGQRTHKPTVLKATPGLDRSPSDAPFLKTDDSFPGEHPDDKTKTSQSQGKISAEMNSSVSVEEKPSSIKQHLPVREGVPPEVPLGGDGDAEDAAISTSNHQGTLSDNTASAKLPADVPLETFKGSHTPTGENPPTDPPLQRMTSDQPSWSRREPEEISWDAQSDSQPSHQYNIYQERDRVQEEPSSPGDQAAPLKPLGRHAYPPTPDEEPSAAMVSASAATPVQEFGQSPREDAYIAQMAPARQYPADSLAPYHQRDKTPHHESRPTPIGGLFRQPNNGRYIVEPGDSMWVISQKVYGTGGFFKALQQHNRSRFPHSHRLHIGDEILTPEVENLRQQYPEYCPKERRVQPGTPQTRPVHGRKRFGGVTYVVEEGDTLYDIAHYELGDGGRWLEIYQTNRDVLHEDFDYLNPGTRLILPNSRHPTSVTRGRSSRYQR